MPHHRQMQGICKFNVDLVLLKRGVLVHLGPHSVATSIGCVTCYQIDRRSWVRLVSGLSKAWWCAKLYMLWLCVASDSVYMCIYIQYICAYTFSIYVHIHSVYMCIYIQYICAYTFSI